MMEFVKTGAGGGNLFNSSLYHSFINFVVVRMKNGYGDDSMMHAFASKYFDYVDVRYFTYITIHKIATTLHTNYISTDGVDAPDSVSRAVKRSNCFHESGGKNPCRMSSNLK